MATTTYVPRHTTGFQLILERAGGQRLVIDAIEGAEPSVAVSDATLAGNLTLVGHLGSFGIHEFSARRTRSKERLASHRRQAAIHREHAEAIADMVFRRTKKGRSGWCSECFEQSNHCQIDGQLATLRTYLCDSCGSPTTACAVPGCKNFASRGITRITPPRYCAEHRHDIPSFNRINDRLACLTDYANWLAYDRFNASRLSKIGAAVVLAGSVVTPVAWAAAPTVGGALGAATGLSGAAATSHGLAVLGGGALSAGGWGMAGGMAVVAAAGGALGGGLGGVTTAAYVRSDSSFGIELLRKGVGTPVVVSNGFLTQGTNGWADWEQLVNARYPDAPVYRVNWGAKEKKAIAFLVGRGGAQHLARKALGDLARRAAKVAGNLPGLGAIFIGAELAANPWSVARTRADMTGVILADLIARTDEPQFVLMGHSLGARVMVSAAQLLGTRSADPKIESMHLLGAAVSTGGDWRSLSSAVTGKVWNYHSRNDVVLSHVFRAAQLGQRAVGGVGFKSSFPNIVDRNVSRTVRGHGQYFKAVKLAAEPASRGPDS